ncbi:hypothetical protein ACH5RR_009190 [Cinchona calisaya]|uniref:AB hydrolase-1 domain-containing protein n=1 Tax=Cinchona calisaya TaxID=153742 RepID=A0ABD3AFF6_9GENT
MFCVTYTSTPISINLGNLRGPNHQPHAKFCRKERGFCSITRSSPDFRLANFPPTCSYSTGKKHFVLVHGSCHGAWCWYKLKPLLESAGDSVTAVDLSASGINTKSLLEIRTLHDYSEPLMELMAAIPADEKVVLVGHSFGGYCLALAMDHCPKKVSLAIFVSAMMPDTVHPPAHFRDKYRERFPAKDMLDAHISSYGSPEEPRTMVTLGPKYLSIKLYQLCSTEDLELAKLLVRPMPILKEDLSRTKPFSAEGYGSVKRAYIVCSEDNIMEADLQHWLAKSVGAAVVKEIKDADHMAMLSKPQELCQYLQEIVDEHI